MAHFTLLRKIRSIDRSIRRFTSNSKGFSSIVGAVFAVLVMISLISTVFVWSLSQNTLYNNAVRQSNLADLDRSNERIVTNATCNRISDTLVSVNGTLKNEGPLSAQIVALWVLDANNSNYAYKTSLNMTLTPGNITTLSGSTAINVTLPNSDGDSLACWFISARGNTIPKNGASATTIIDKTQIYYNSTITNSTITNSTIYYNSTEGNTTYADVASGIGLLAFNFKEFSNIDLGTSAPANHTLLGTFVKNYWLRQDHYTIFHAILTNYDPDKKTMVLNSSSCIYALIAQSNTMKYGFWSLVNVTKEAGDKLYVNSALPGKYSLPWGEPVDVYFLGRPSVANPVLGVYPLNIMAFGKLGTDDYGQNVPFVSMNLLS